MPRDAAFATTMGAYLDTVLPVYGRDFADWWRDRLRPEMERNFAFLEARLDAADAMDLADTACLLEDAIDIHDRHWKIHWMLNFAQLSATLNLRAVMQKARGTVDEALLGRLQNSASDRNWDSIEALWRMKNEVRDEPELPAAFASDDTASIATALRSSERGRRSSPSGSSRTSASSAGTPSGATSSSSRRFASRWNRSSSWSAATCRPTTTSRARSRRCGSISRLRRARSSTG